jgi:hypothetical protein
LCFFAPIQPMHVWGVFVTREHIRHNKSGIAHQDKSLKRTPNQVHVVCLVCVFGGGGGDMRQGGGGHAGGMRQQEACTAGVVQAGRCRQTTHMPYC